MADENKLEIEDAVAIRAKVVRIDGKSVTFEIADDEGLGHCVTLNGSQVTDCVTKN